jgi:hypothetical protein
MFKFENRVAIIYGGKKCIEKAGKIYINGNTIKEVITDKETYTNFINDLISKDLIKNKTWVLDKTNSILYID